MPISISKDDALQDYRIAYRSRQASLIGRREALTGKAKFGIFGDGKEVAQLAMARAFRQGDIRSGYYRDQTFMLALGMTDLEAFFAQLYADPDPAHEPASAGRQMNAHFATRLLDGAGHRLPMTDRYNSVADASPTSAQMPRLVGLAYASRLYRELDTLDNSDFSKNGDEIAFGTIGNASCAEGPFWETINAIGVLHAPMLLSIWDDDYGISVPNEHQITKGDLSAVLRGFQRQGESAGYDLYTVRGWDYPALCATYAEAATKVRAAHVPAILHVIELTQPQGHSSSGSHERYKSKERLEWELEHDCLRRMRAWLIEQGHTSNEELEAMEAEDLATTRAAQQHAWQRFIGPIGEEMETLADHLRAVAATSSASAEIEASLNRLERLPSPSRRHLMVAVREALIASRSEDNEARRALVSWRKDYRVTNRRRYSSHLYSESTAAALAVPATPVAFDADAPLLNGSEVLNHFFDQALNRIPELIAFGEDVGQIGDVNQGFAGLQAKHGPLRVADTGIRECTILGQAIGMALRGLRPLAEIQYLDYVLYALQILADDLATLHYRSRGSQKAPVIVRTRGHRLEGIWHSGSPMAGILNMIRGIYVCVPRDMTRAAGFYNTMLRSDDSALIVEVLNGYRIKERLPNNLDTFTLPLGVPEILRPGDDITLVTYGACCRIALEAAALLADVGIEVEVIDVQTLLPFDLHGTIGHSLARTNRIVFLDEDVPGGTTAYMLQQVIEGQKGYHWLDAEPRTLSSQAHRPAYGSDGDYWSKPNVETLFETVYELMHEAAPQRFPIFYR